MSDIYEQHKAAFPNVSAFVVMRGGERVATVAIKYPRDGAGRLYAYVHLIGVPMVRAHANGFGYDKRSAAVAAAIAKIPAPVSDHFTKERYAKVAGWHGTLRFSVAEMESRDWTQALERQGFTVIQAV